MELKVTVEVLNNGTPVASGEIIRDFSLQAGYPMAVKMGNILDAVIAAIKDDSYE